MVVKAFIFDLGRVIVDLDFTRFIDEIISNSQLYNSNAMDLLNKFWNETSIYDLGNITEEDFYILSCDFLKIKYISREVFIDAFNSVIGKTNLKLVELIRKLKKIGRYKLVALSNVNPTHWEYGRKNLWNFLHLFDELLLSFKLHMIKPDLELFKHAIKECSCNPEEIVYIDDKIENIQAARNLGIQGIHYLGLEHLVNVLKTLKIDI
ncbi:MAG: HAD-IA family hydrolase [Promethearchaeota archaeon]